LPVHRSSARTLLTLLPFGERAVRTPVGAERPAAAPAVLSI